MELIKKNVHMNKLKCRCNTQLTLDDDFNVPDVKPDIDRIVKEQGVITLSEVKPLNGKVSVRGELNFNLLYVSADDDRPVHNIIGRLPFEEMINMDDATPESNINLKWEVEDLSTSLINSRKVSVKSIVGFRCMAESIYDEETAIGVEATPDVQYLNKKMEITQLAINKKDTYRIKDEITLPTGKPNIMDVHYHELELRNVDTRMGDNKISLKGELIIFMLYSSEAEDQSVQYYETEIPFSGSVDCSGCNENMISDICIQILSKSLDVKADTDGENRVVDIEVVLDLDVKAYEEEMVDVLCDVYSTAKRIHPYFEEAGFENIITKNNSKVRVVDHIMVDNNSPSVLQICNVSGNIKIDDMELVNNGIQVEGVVYVQILYITDDDSKPLGCIKGVVPFSQVIEVKNINENCLYDVKPSIEQLNVIMMDSNDIEVKCSISLDSIVMEQLRQMVIRNVTEEEMDLGLLQEMPSLTGYIVKPGDTMWAIAKEFYTTVDSIMETNDMDSSTINVGDHLLLIKKVDAIC